MKVVLAGCTGFIGAHLARKLAASGHECTVLIRNHLSAQPPDFQKVGRLVSYSEMPDSADAVINLIGEPIIGRWTDAKKKAVLDSRVDSTEMLVKWMSQLKVKPSVLLSSSAVGYYGDGGDTPITEQTPPDTERRFLAQVCIPWEHEANMARMFGTRVVNLRTGVVLDPGGGMLLTMVPMLRLAPFIVPFAPSSYLPWISMRDEVGIIEFAMTHEIVSGPINLAAPTPATLGDLFESLGTELHRPVIGRVPTFLLKAALGELSQTMLASQKIVPEKIVEAGYVFQDLELGEFLRGLDLSKREKPQKRRRRKKRVNTPRPFGS